MAEYVNLDEMKAEFLSFAIEAYKTKLGVSGAKVAEYRIFCWKITICFTLSAKNSFFLKSNDS